jgi:hemerythrin
MNLPQLPLGVAVMDDDHYALEQMIGRSAWIEEADLPAHLDAIIAEMAAHFAREEAEMEKIGVPILHCHKGQHKALLEEADKLRATFAGADERTRRRLIGFVLAHMVANHIATVDQISSTFFDRKRAFNDAEPAGCGG